MSEPKGAKLCPECGHILIKYKVGHGVGFSVYDCGACHGIWLDKHEWDVLKQHNLHDEIHLILDASWQRQIRSEASKQKLEQIYEKRFGPETFAEIKKIQSWLAAQPQRSALLAYLGDKER